MGRIEKIELRYVDPVSTSFELYSGMRGVIQFIFDRGARVGQARPAPAAGRASAAGSWRAKGRTLAIVPLILVVAGTLRWAGPAHAATPDQAGTTSAAVPGGILDAALFYLVAAGTVVSALGVCLTKNIVRMAVWLFVTLGSVAMLYFLLSANFLGAIQLIVYAGGTLVLLIFGVMLTSKSPWVRFEARAGEVIAAGVVCVGLLSSLCLVLLRAAWTNVEGVVPGAALADLGRRLLTVYLVPFEIAGVLLFIVMVGAAHLARQES